MRAASKDLVFGMALLALSLFVLLWLIPVGIDSPGNINDPALAPAFWPRLIMITMVGLSVILMLQGIRGIRRIRKSGADREEGHIPNPVGETKVAFAAAMLFVFTWFMTWAGIVVPSMVALVFYIVLHGEKRLKIVAPVAAGVPIGLYLFFLKVAQVPMPLGIFEDFLW
jgi:hypothetical protein